MSPSPNWKPIPGPSIDRRILIERMEKASVGDLLPYSELSALLGRDVREKARGSLYSAVRYLRRQNGMVFAAVSNVGMKRLDDTEKISVAESAMRRIRKTAGRAVEALSCVDDFAGLSEDLRVRHQTLMAGAGAVATITSKKKLDQLQKRVREVGNVLPLAKTLEAFI